MNVVGSVDVTDVDTSDKTVEIKINYAHETGRKV